MFSIITTLALLASTALSTPISNPALALRQDTPTIPANWTWHISEWGAGCARTCYYGFNITVPSTPSIPGVKAYCSGYESNSLYKSCKILEGANNSVSAKLTLRDEEQTAPKQVFFSFELAGYEERPAYNYTAAHQAVYNAYVAPHLDFDVTPTEVGTD